MAFHNLHVICPISEIWHVDGTPQQNGKGDFQLSISDLSNIIRNNVASHHSHYQAKWYSL